ncbi:MAG: hypothetical protein PIR02_19355 [Microbacterium enclense]
MPHHPRITPVPTTGAHVVTVAEDVPLLRLRTGDHTAIGAPPSELHGILDSPSPGSAASAYRDRLVGEIRDRESADDERRWPSARRRIGVVGTGVLADEIARVLGEWGARVGRGTSAAASPDSVALVISVSDGAAERRDHAVLDDLLAAGAARLRVYREGECVLVDPLAVDVTDITATQVARRRIAASTVPGALDAWQLQGPAADQPMDSASVTLVTARVLTMTLAWAQDDEALSRLRTTLWKLVPALGRVTEHPVLAYPAPHPGVGR